MHNAAGAGAAATQVKTQWFAARLGLAHPGRQQRAIAIDLALQLIEHALHFGGLRLRRPDDQSLKREAIRSDPIGEAQVDDFDHVRVFAHAPLGVDPLVLVEVGYIIQALLPLLIDVHHAAGRFEKLRQTRRVVADVVDQLRVT